MQAGMQNPDTRPLPAGWAQHFDTSRGLWYYIDLGIANPRVTFVHPCDERPISTQPVSAPALQTSMSNDSASSGGSSSSPTISPATTLRREHTRLAVRPLGSRESLKVSRGRRATVAQQLYASSVTPKPTVSPSHSRRPSASGPHNPYLEDPMRGGSPLAGSSSQNNANAQQQQQRGRTNSTATGSSSSGSSPTSASGGGSGLLDSHDPRNFFNYTRFPRGTRRMTYNGPQTGPSATPSASTSISPPSTSSQVPSSSQLPTPAPSASPSPSAFISSPHNSHSASTAAPIGTLSGTHEQAYPPTNRQSTNPIPALANLALLPEPRSVTTNSSPGAFEQAQAFYHPSVNPKPVLQIPESTSAPTHPHRSNLPSPPDGSDPSHTTMPAGISTRSAKALPPVPISIQKVDLKQKQPVRGARVLPEPYHKYTSVTEDETLLAMPQSDSNSQLGGTFSGLTEDNLMVLPGHQTPAQSIVQATRLHLPSVPPAINVMSIQDGDTQLSNVIASHGARTGSGGQRRRSPPRIETRLARRNTVASSPTKETAPRLVLQQPKPIRPLTGVPVSLNLQVQLASANSDCESIYTDGVGDRDKDKEVKGPRARKGFGLGSMSIFGPRTKDGASVVGGRMRDGEEYDPGADESFVLVHSP